jgi:hypothetical protein
MRKQRCSLILAVVAGLLLWTGPAQAQDGAVQADTEAIHIAGSVQGGAPGASFVLTARQDVEGLAVIISDLSDTIGSGVPRDPVLASSVTIAPAASWPQVSAGDALQVSLLVSPPATAGTWSGTLTVHWRRPVPGTLRLPVTLTMRNQPVLALVTAGTIKVAAMRGDVVPRTVLLQETAGGLPAAGLQTLSTDLSTAAGTVILPAARVQVSLPVTQVTGGGLLPLSLTFDLRDVPSNDYSGNVLVTDENHNLVTIPVQVTVKDHWLLPLAVLVLGVILGLSLTAYRTYGRPRDRLLIRMADIRERLATENHPFLTASVERQLQLVEDAVAGQRWEEGDAAATQAEALITRWRQERSDWLLRLAERAALQARLAALPAEVAQSAIARALRLQLEQIDLEDFAGAEALQQTLAVIDGQLHDLEQLIERWQAVREALDTAVAQGQLPAAEAATYRDQLDDLLQRLQSVASEPAAEVQALADAVVALGRSLAAAIQAQAGVVERRDNCLDAVAALLATPPIMADDDPIRVAVTEVTASVAAQPDATLAADWAENAWRGLWSARTILPLAAPAVATARQPERALRRWLADASNYQQPSAAFRAALLERETALRDAALQADAGLSWPAEPPLPAATVRIKGMSSLADLERLGAGIALAPLPRGEVVGAGCAPGLLAGLWQVLTARRRAGAGPWTRVRLWAFNAVVYLVLVVMLAWLGFNQLYVASATFGSSAAVDYFSLLMWGLGIDVFTRAGVLETLKGLLSEA